MFLTIDTYACLKEKNEVNYIFPLVVMIERDLIDNLLVFFISNISLFGMHILVSPKNMYFLLKFEKK